jgi:hypothetical protein
VARWKSRKVLAAVGSLVLGAGIATVLTVSTASASPGRSHDDGFYLYCTPIDRTPGYYCTPTNEDAADRGGWSGGSGGRGGSTGGSRTATPPPPTTTPAPTPTVTHAPIPTPTSPPETVPPPDFPGYTTEYPTTTLAPPPATVGAQPAP